MAKRIGWACLVVVAAAAQPPPDLPAAIALHPRVPELAPGQQMPDLISFPCGGLTLHGWLYRPAGTGPFPAVLWNHGSEKTPGWQPELAAFYNRRGFVFFVPHRHGHGRSPGAYIGDAPAATPAEKVRLHELYHADVAAAVEWLKSQPFVDWRRIVMSGVSYGGIQTLLAAEKGLGVRAFIPFAPAAMSWGNPELRRRLLRAVRDAQAPVFLIQAANDYSLGPSEVLGPEIRRRGRPNRATVYPPFGSTPQQGHGAFACWNLGTDIWGREVLDFIQAVLSPAPARPSQP